MNIRKYRSEDCKYLEELFYDTVHSVNAKDYTKEQLNVWATGNVDIRKWDESLSAHYSVVAVENDLIVGFGDMDETGYLDRLYVHKDYQKKGIATAICDELEMAVPAVKYVTHASITARPFFEKRGYRVVKEQQVKRQGIFLTNYVMEGKVMNTPTLETERLILRQFTDQDIDALFEIYSDEEVNTYLPWYPLKSIEEVKSFFEEKYEKTYRQPGGHRYAICLKSDNVPIGYIHVDAGDSHDLGYGLRKEFWHKGIVTEAGRAVIEQLKKDGIPYITATHDVKNPRSGGVIQQLGMQYQYSYEEQWQPKDILVTFRMYQLNFDGQDERVYTKYWDISSVRFKETDI